MKRFFILLGIILVAIQFIRPDRNLGALQQPKDVFVQYPASDTVMALVKKACYDCHSNNTVYPWYANIQPVALWLAHHVDEGKVELNFSEFASYPAKKADHKMEEVIEQIQEKEMPLLSYTLIHKDAELSTEQREMIIAWADGVRKKVGVN